MAMVFEHILFLFAIITMVFAVQSLRKDKRKLPENRLFFAFCVSSSIWSFFFGLLMIQSRPEAAYLCRTIGMIGTFSYMIMANLLIVRWSRVRKTLRKFFFWFPFLAIILFPFNVRRSAVTFYQTQFGMTYEFVKDIWSSLYSLYSLIYSVNVAIMLCMMMNKGMKMRERIMGKRLLLCLFSLVLGAVFDTILPQYGYAAIPGSTFTQFFGAVVMMHVLKYSNCVQMTLSNMSEFVYYSLKTPVLIYDDFGRLRIVNSSAAEQFGMSAGASCNLKLSDIFITDVDVTDVRDGNRSIEALKRGSDIYCSIDINAIYDDFRDTVGYIVVTTDLTEKMKTIHELEKARCEADNANAAKSIFLANMSHEIRTPINAVLGMNELIIRESSEKKILRYAGSIRDAGKSLLLLINDILDFSKIEAGKMELVCIEYSTRDFVRSISNMFTHRAREKELSIRVEADSMLPRTLYGDEARLRQIISNLVGNSIKYTDAGGIWVRITMGEIDEAEQTVELRMEVEDTGIGIKEEDFADLFTPFARFDEKTHKTVAGTGLGLGIVKRLTDLMGGSVTVSSVYHKGSRFCVNIRQKIVSAQPLGSMDNNTYGDINLHSFVPGFAAPDASILIVDDNKTNIEVIRGLLGCLGMKIFAVMSGEECLDAVKRRSYDIVLLDHMMPDMDGIETLRRLKLMEEDLHDKPVIIALTANALVGAKEFYLSRGFDDYLAKPVDYSKLEDMLRKYLPPEKILEDISSLPDKENEYCGFEQSTLRSELAAAQIDIESGLLYCHDMEIYAATARSFYCTANERAEELKRYFETDNLENYRVAVHGIKSGARTLGAVSLYELAYGQERRCVPGAGAIVVVSNKL